MRIVFTLVLVLLTGCATPRLLTANERSVVVEGPLDAWAKTQLVADAECAKHGLKSRFAYDSGGYPHQYFYDCVR